MSIKSTLVKNTSLNLIGYIYLTIAAFIAIPILLRNLGQDLYGVYLLFSSLIPLMAALDFGLNQASIRFLSLPDKTQSTRCTIWRTSFTSFFFVGFLIALVSFTFFNFFAPNSPAFSALQANQFFPLALTISFILLFNHLNISFMTLIQSNQRFDIYNLRVLIVGTANTLITALVSSFTSNLIHVFVVLLFFHLVVFFIYLRYVCHQFTFSFPRFCFQKTHYRQLFSFGLRQFIGNLANQANTQISKYILGLSLSAATVPIFAVPQNVIVKGAGAISQLTLSFFPLSASLITKEKIKKLSRLVINLEVIILILGILQILFIYNFGDDVLHLWLKNPSFVDQAYPVLKILSWYFFLTTTTPIPTSVLDSINRPQIPSLFAVLTTILTLSSMLYFVPQHGAVGAAYAYVFASLITVPSFLIVFTITFSRYVKKTLASSRS